MTLAIDGHRLTPDALIDLYIVDLSTMNVPGFSDTYYFATCTHTDGSPINYLGHTYQPLPIIIEGIEKRGTGASARPTVEISNIGGVISDLCSEYDDLVGATVIRRRTLSNYIALNTPEYLDDFYKIEQRTGEGDTVQFILASPVDFLDKQLPGVIAIANSCPHQYKSILHGSGCGWPGTDSTRWFAADGSATTNQAADSCGKRLSDCKLRFGANNPLDYGGNPGLGRSSP
jgi:lambda family phage minor tail protein L